MYQSEKLPLFVTAVNGDWSHSILPEIFIFKY